MRLRIKFTKTGQLKYIGHLDVMRYFQKVLRRACVDVVFSGGFSPHMIMSFALPLGVGATSIGEYFDVDVNDGFDFTGLTEKMNSTAADDMRVLDVVRVSDKKADKCMTVVEAADYTIDFGDNAGEIRESFLSFMLQDEIMVLKKTKSGEKLTDIKPMILSSEEADDNKVNVRLSAGSRAHLNPALLVDAFMSSFRTEDRPEKEPEEKTEDNTLQPQADIAGISVCRTEMYALENNKYIPLNRCRGVIGPS